MLSRADNEVEFFAKSAVNKMLHRVHALYGQSLWDMKVRTSFSSYRARSIGGVRRGVPFVSLSLSTARTSVSFFEYSRLANDPEIGTVHNTHWRLWVATLVAHELSHVIQYHPGCRKQVESMWGMFDAAPHGSTFRAIYRDLRNAFVNGAAFAHNFGNFAVNNPVSSPVRAVNQYVSNVAASNHETFVVSKVDVFKKYSIYTITKNGIVNKLILMENDSGTFNKVDMVDGKLEVTDTIFNNSKDAIESFR